MTIQFLDVTDDRGLMHEIYHPSFALDFID